MADNDEKTSNGPQAQAQETLMPPTYPTQQLVAGPEQFQQATLMHPAFSQQQQPILQPLQQQFMVPQQPQMMYQVGQFPQMAVGYYGGQFAPPPQILPVPYPAPAPAPPTTINNNSDNYNNKNNKNGGVVFAEPRVSINSAPVARIDPSLEKLRTAAIVLSICSIFTGAFPFFIPALILARKPTSIGKRSTYMTSIVLAAIALVTFIIWVSIVASASGSYSYSYSISSNSKGSNSRGRYSSGSYYGR